MRALLLAAFLLAACEGADAAGSDASALPEDAALADASTPPRDAASAGLDAGRPEDASASEDGGDPCSRPGVQTIVALAASPALVKIARGAQIDLTLLATFSSGCVKEVTSVYLASSDPAVAAVDVSALAVVVRGLANGSAILQASTQQGGQGVVSNDVAVTVEDPTTPPPTETRALWITRFAYREDPTDGAADIRGIIDRAKAAHFNTLFLQVRGAGDAYYQSTLEPSWGGGKGLGEDPGWDPLRVGLEYAHQQGMQLHAYLNAMSGWTKSAGAIPDTTPPHVLRAHPELTCRDSAGSDSADGEYIYLAADPAYRAHLADVVEDVITHYAVDGIHLDRIRTPGPDYCHSPALDLAFQQEGGSWADFSRRQIDETVKAIHERMLARDPQLVLSAAVWGIHQKPAGCTGGASEGYHDFHQDSLGWAQRGWVDMLAPMTYWPIKPGACTDWAALSDLFQAGANGRLVVAGMTASRGAFPELVADIDYARQKKLAGTVVFASGYLDQFSLWDDYLSGPFLEPAVPTPMSHR